MLSAQLTTAGAECRSPKETAAAAPPQQERTEVVANSRFDFVNFSPSSLPSESSNE